MQISKTLSVLLAAFPAFIAAQGAANTCREYAITGGDPPGLWLEAVCDPTSDPNQVTRVRIGDCYGNYGGKPKLIENRYAY